MTSTEKGSCQNFLHNNHSVSCPDCHPAPISEMGRCPDCGNIRPNAFNEFCPCHTTPISDDGWVNSKIDEWITLSRLTPFSEDLRWIRNALLEAEKRGRDRVLE